MKSALTVFIGAAALAGCVAPAPAPSYDLDEDPDALAEHESKSDGNVCADYDGGPLSGDGLLVLVNKDGPQQLRSDWAPKDLVGLPTTAVMPGRSPLMRKVATDAFVELAAAANAEAGLNLVARSGYRSFRTQCITFDYKVQQSGLEHAQRFSAEPGRSQHQLGTTVDITSASLNYEIEESMEGTAEALWLEDSAHRFGFSLSYPEGAEDITGYGFEPWHYRYIGRDAAWEMHEGELILEEYLRGCLDGTCASESIAFVPPNTYFIGGACDSDADCASLGPDGTCLGNEDGYTGGHCTLPCASSCPDRAGNTTTTACADVDDGLCHSRCDFDVFPESGCRDAYECVDTQTPTGHPRSVCLP